MMFDDKDFVLPLILILVMWGLVTCAALFPDSDNNQSTDSSQAQQLNSVKPVNIKS